MAAAQNEQKGHSAKETEHEKGHSKGEELEEEKEQARRSTHTWISMVEG